MSYIKAAIEVVQKKFDTLNLITLSRSCLENNLRIINDLSGNREIIPVLKANAYGHGLTELAKMLEQSDFEFPRVAVDAYYEALDISKNTNLKPLIMGPILPTNFSKIDTSGFAFVAQSIDSLRDWADSDRKVTLHLEFDTGMKRHGIEPGHVEDVIKIVGGNPNITIEGVMTHLADADNPNEDDFVKAQYDKFDRVIDELRTGGVKPELIHVQQSGGVTRSNFTRSNAVRPGIALYGISPLVKSDPRASDYEGLQPVLELGSKISCTQVLLAGQTTSYSRTYKAKKKEKIAVIPVGYFEALPRTLSNKGFMYDTSGNSYPIRGRICMNHVMADVTGSKLDYLAEVIVISRNKENKNSLQNICKLSGEFNYEVLVNLAATTRRKIVD